jgi:hypothetical protein
MFEDWEAEEVSEGTILVALDGKLQGSRARQLGDRLETLLGRRSAQVARIILDLRQVSTIDSLGIMALETPLEQGVKLDLVVKRGFELDDGRQATELARRGLRVHSSLEIALGTARSGRLVASA